MGGNNMSANQFFNLTAWTKDSLDKCFLGLKSLWTNVPWTNVCLDICRVKKLGISSIKNFRQFAFGYTDEAGPKAQLLDRSQQNVDLIWYTQRDKAQPKPPTRQYNNITRVYLSKS